MKTWQIKIIGQVQGVGFRPFVWKTAVGRGLSGQVSNGMSGVEILLNADEAQVLDFKDFIIKNAPKGSRVTAHQLLPCPDRTFDTFSIVESQTHDQPLLLISPDVALCPDCLADLRARGNRRFGYAFTTCTYCGPRYSVIDTLPYDRENTAMHPFVMCPDCLAEYHDPANRRFFAQTNSCPACGIALRLLTPDGHEQAANDAALKATLRAWKTGQIVAIKSIGGYLLTCDATQHRAVELLRQRKRRPSKPFALMYPDVPTLLGDVQAGDAMLAMLQSPAAPIVLFDLKERPRSGIATQVIAPGLARIGAMLPYTPLMALLLESYQKPVIATSGNASHAPIVYRDEDLSQLADIADFFLSNNRDIVVPQDDSVVAFAQGHAPVVMRRSRGWAPAPPPDSPPFEPSSALALGAEMKGAFAVTYQGNLFLSQYLGDMSDFDAQQRMEQLLRRTLAQFRVQPETIITDLHPGYFSTQLGKNMAEATGVVWKTVQHHEAHFAAVLAENQLLDEKEPVLGVIWDGTGLGHDGQVWGGEWFRYQKGTAIERVGHWPAFPVLMGDKMSREPRLSALSLCHTFSPQFLPELEEKFTPTEWTLYLKMISRPDLLRSSSMGRVFDGVASLLGLADKVSFEGEAAMLLEAAARHYLNKHPELKSGYFSANDAGASPFALHWWPLLVADSMQRRPAGYVAAMFHLTLTEMVAASVAAGGIHRVAFSGGVFQNTLLVELLLTRLSPDTLLFFHKNLAPNDENIAFGQLIHHTFMR